MLNDMNILHIAPTPLVGAPVKVVKALAAVGVNARCLLLSDYPKQSGLQGFFTDGAELINSATAEGEMLLRDALEWADVVHVHNFLSEQAALIIKEYSSKIFVYQVHSPQREGPVFTPRVNEFGIGFSKYLVLAQYHPRHYPGYEIVPNLVLFDPVCEERQGDVLKVLFTPTHARGGRWNSKGDPRLPGIFEQLVRDCPVEMVSLKGPVTPGKLFEIRTQCHVSIDEIVTGAYHQVSLEGMAAGNVVVNAADYFSCRMLQRISGADRRPPFLNANVDTVYDVLSNLANNMDLTMGYIRETASYYRDFMDWRKLVLRYVDVYKAL
ncbi:hypothetical protein [Parathalassolituus penaei]|uniref:Glycosyltransferase n=1 Tax=Parathalassolituus penaei TaxID=2997323 RepID=A0A9X3EGK8_9GAMM|nr:hypothetical protein [Parathalassolituus penaei]MCY0966836.1 hypothetical protein [Parathalassolituus penaei]